MPKILWLITARSGSKSVPNKNVRLLGSIPLLAYRILTALKCPFESEIWLSTDSKEYASIGEEFGAKVPFIRPDNLAGDNSSSIDVVLHAMEHAESVGKEFELIGLLEPTSPFIYPYQLEDAVTTLLGTNNAAGIVATREARPSPFFVQDNSMFLDVLAKRFKNEQNLRRQNFVKQITPSGGFYISKWDTLKEHCTFYTEKTLAFEVPEECSVEIDDPIDWEFAEFLLSKGLVDLKKLLP